MSSFRDWSGASRPFRLNPGSEIEAEPVNRQRMTNPRRLRCLFVRLTIESVPGSGNAVDFAACGIILGEARAPALKDVAVSIGVLPVKADRSFVPSKAARRGWLDGGALASAPQL